MDDLISRQAAIDALEQIFDRCEEIEAHLPEGDPDRTGYKMYQDYMTVWKYLHQLPSAQPEIIRCKDCEHWDTSWETVYGLHYCPRIDMATNKNFFCKYGAKTRGDKHGN